MLPELITTAGESMAYTLSEFITIATLVSLFSSNQHHKACVEIAIKLQKRRSGGGEAAAVVVFSGNRNQAIMSLHLLLEIRWQGKQGKMSVVCVFWQPKSGIMSLHLLNTSENLEIEVRNFGVFVFLEEEDEGEVEKR